MAGSAGSEWSWEPTEEDEGLGVLLAARDEESDDEEFDDDEFDDDDLDDDDLDDDDDDDLIDLDDEYDDADEDDRPHPGKFDE